MELRHLQARRGGLRAAGRILGGVEPLRDAHGRTITDLRVSVTDRCNFRCRYCMPAEGMPLARPRRACSASRRSSAWSGCSSRLGITDVRLTGGEPLARRDFPRLVAMLRRIEGIERPLADHQRLPARARRRRPGRGRDRPRQRLDRLARPRPLPRDHPPRRAPAGAARARGDRRARAGAADQGQRGRDARLHRGRGRSRFAELARSSDYQVRFIEFMPLDGDRAWSPIRS